MEKAIILWERSFECFVLDTHMYRDVRTALLQYGLFLLLSPQTSKATVILNLLPIMLYWHPVNLFPPTDSWGKMSVRVTDFCKNWSKTPRVPLMSANKVFCVWVLSLFVYTKRIFLLVLGEESTHTGFFSYYNFIFY